MTLRAEALIAVGVRRAVNAALPNRGRVPSGNAYDSIMGLAERPLIEAVMQRCGGNQVQAADALGINRNTLRKLLQRHDLLKAWR